MYVNKTDDTQEAENEGRKPVIIDVATDQSVRFNVPNGMILEIDLSDLPSDQAAREEEIRSRVRDLILDITGDSKEAILDRDSLADSIIKNITQIVMIQMDEALKKHSESLIPSDESSEKPLSIPDIMESIFNIIPSTSTTGPTGGPDTVIPEPEITSTASNELGNDEKTTASSSRLPESNKVITPPNPTLLTNFDSLEEAFVPLVLASSPSANSQSSVSTTATSLVTPASVTPSGERPTSEVPQEEVNNVINNVKKTISQIITDVLEGANDETNTEEILESIVSRVPAGIKIMAADVNGEDLRTQITQSVSTILSEKAADQLRNRADEEEKKEKEEDEAADVTEENIAESSAIGGSTTPSEKRYRTDASAAEEEVSSELPTSGRPILAPTPSSPVTAPSSTRESSTQQDTTGAEKEAILNPINDENISLTNLPALFPGILTADEKENEIDEEKESDVDYEVEEEEVTGLVLNPRPQTTVRAPIWEIVLNASPEDNDIENSEPDKTNSTSKIIQDGRIIVDTSNSGVVKAKVVEDTNFLARSIGERANIGVPAIISIVIGVLAILCFSLMVFLAMARRRRQMEAIGAPSSTGYTSTARYRSVPNMENAAFNLSFFQP